MEAKLGYFLACSHIPRKLLLGFYNIIGYENAVIGETDDFKRHDAMEVFLKDLGRYLRQDENAFIHPAEQDKTPVLQYAERISEYNQDPIKSAKEEILKICGELAETGYYNEHDGIYRKYFELIDTIRAQVSTCKTNDPKRVDAINRILDETEMMVEECEIPNVCDRWLEANPRLKFYDCVFEFHRQDPELYQQIANGEVRMEIFYNKPIRFRFIPTEEKFKAEEKYHAEMLARQKNNNETEEEQYQREVITAVEILLEQDLA